MNSATVKNWTQFQHYKDRSPPWIKLHRALLDDFSFSSLPLASKALAPLLWLLAAETQEGSVSTDAEWIAFRLRWNVKDVRAGLSPLIEKGFLVAASSALAPRLQLATPETETETEKEKDFERQAARFAEFWSVYPNRKGKAEAEKKWKARKLDAIADQIIADVRSRIANDRDWLRGFIPHGSTYVNAEGWNDGLPPAEVPAKTGKPEPVCNPHGVSPQKPETAADRAAAKAAFEASLREFGVSP